ncbi:MAG: hypothetical protein ACKUBY_04165 [Candidatus Moraniibacteriota bacterium]|jgi:hypothetical protein
MSQNTMLDELGLSKWSIDMEIDGKEKEFTIFFHHIYTGEEVLNPMHLICTDCGVSMEAVEYPVIEVVRIIDTTDTTNTPVGVEEEILKGDLFEQVSSSLLKKVASSVRYDDLNQCSKCIMKASKMEMLKDVLLSMKDDEMYEPRNKI